MLLAIEFLKERRRIVHILLEARKVMELAVNDYNPGSTTMLLRSLNKARRQAQAQESRRERVDLQPN